MLSKIVGTAAVVLLVVGGAGCGKSSSKASASSSNSVDYCAAVRKAQVDVDSKASDPKAELESQESWLAKELPSAPPTIRADVQAELGSIRSSRVIWTRVGYDESKLTDADQAALYDPATIDRETRIDDFNQAHCHLPSDSSSTKFSRVGSAVQ